MAADRVYLDLLRAYYSLLSGEQEIMDMWNQHRSVEGFIIDSQIPASVETFIDVNGITIWERDLYQPLLTLLEHLRQEGLITTEWKNMMVTRILNISNALFD